MLSVSPMISQLSNLSDDTITAIESGEFSSLSTWSGNVIPRNGSTVIIPKNITVRITNHSNWIIDIQSVRIFGKLEIGPLRNSSSRRFPFEYAINIMIFNGGILEDLSSSHEWSLSTNTIITIYNGALFTFVEPITLISNENNSNKRLNSSINGPHTITVDLQGQIKSYSSITFSPSVSGDFGLNSTWLGGLAPTFDRCSPNDGGCELIIPHNFNISRRNNQSTMNAVNVYINGLFEISSWSSYLFLYPMNFFVYDDGVFQDSTKDGFWFYINTSIYIYNGDLFVTQNPTSIKSYIERNVIISQIRLNSSEIRGPYSLIINHDGRINVNNSSLTSTTTQIPTITNIGILFKSSFSLIFFIILFSLFIFQ